MRSNSLAVRRLLFAQKYHCLESVGWRSASLAAIAFVLLELDLPVLTDLYFLHLPFHYSSFAHCPAKSSSYLHPHLSRLYRLSLAFTSSQWSLQPFVEQKMWMLPWLVYLLMLLSLNWIGHRLPSFCLNFRVRLSWASQADARSSSCRWLWQTLSENCFFNVRYFQIQSWSGCCFMIDNPYSYSLKLYLLKWY